MVLPLPDDVRGPQTLVGPPPPELHGRFRTIKYCLVVLIFVLIVKVAGGIVAYPTRLGLTIQNSACALLNVFIGIFLLNDDPMFAGCHRRLVNTFCAGCADQCQGGMACLCTWSFCCSITAMAALLPFRGGDLVTIVVDFHLITSSEAWSDSGKLRFTVGFLIFALATVCALLSQLIGGWAGFKAFQRASELTVEAGWPAQDDPPHGRFGDFGGFGGGPLPQQLGAPGTSRPAAGGFVAFSGAGNKLGS